jgi:hypothetical protein
MAILSLTPLYLNMLTKTLVSVNGSPTSIPAMFYGDKQTFQIFPVQPVSSNASQGYQQFVLGGYICNLTMAGAPNATSPPTPFAVADGLTYVAVASPGFGYFMGTLDLTQSAVGTYIGNNASAQAYFNIDVFDAALLRTTLIQTTFTLNASIDTLTVGPPAPVASYLTANQIAALYVAIGPVTGKFITFRSADGTKTKTLFLDNDGAEKWN